MAAAFLSQIATFLPFLFGLSTASIIVAKSAEHMDPAAPNYVGGLLAIAPTWYFVPVCLIALIGGMSTGTTSLYGTGLDFSSVFASFTRVRATVFVGTLSIVFIFVGRFAANLTQSISTFATLIITCTAPWMVIMMLGYVTRRGWYDPDALQVFNRRQRGGRYWFTHGWNWRGLTASIVLVATGWSAHWGTDAYLAHPYLTEEAAALLVERGVRTVGIDALSVDPTPAADFPAHRVLCGAHAVIAENLTGLDRLLRARADGLSVEVSMLPIRLGGADGAPVRAVARVTGQAQRVPQE
ncbi:cytosine permease [Nonomuraea cavernae]|uniref:cytosine permease n=1 Tax=Nonomuraea cavernae TaxID=2045107 RepID=UPI00166D12AF|nr:cytosine permease [Nonomuraea cavernae]MCA2190507.1 cytosine permease [Nonomuraea cavernae]